MAMRRDHTTSAKMIQRRSLVRSNMASPGISRGIAQSFLCGPQLRGGNARKSRRRASLPEVAIPQALQLLPAAFHLAVAGMSVAAEQGLVEVARMAGQFDHVAWRMFQPAW